MNFLSEVVGHCMNLSQLKTLVKKGESETLEFKNSTGGLKEAMQTVCAFLNSDHGGVIIFGVDDKGRILGQEVTDDTITKLSAELKKIDPFVKNDIQYVAITDKLKAIVLRISSGDKAPYNYDGRPYIRNQATTSRMSKEDYEYLYYLQNPHRWENITTSKFQITNLDGNRIKEVVKMAIFEHRMPETAARLSVSEVLKKMNLVIDHKITNAAIILFCKQSKIKLMQSTLQLARFKGVDKKEFLDTKFIQGNAFDLYDQAMDFLHFNLPISARIESGKQSRVETPAIPYSVLREAVTNALVHRDYSHEGSAITIAIYTDRVNITNVGSLPKGVNIGQLSREHTSVQRNPLIAHVFYLCGKIEKWGRGTLDMINDCKAAGNPAPIYEEVGNSFSVTLPLREPIHQKEKITNKEHPNITTRQRKILDLLKENSLSRQQIMKKLRVAVSERTIQRDLFFLEKEGLIKSNGQSKAMLWFLI